MNSRQGSSFLVRPAICLLSAILFLVTTASTASPQEGDPDQPMIVGIVPGPVAAVDLFLKIDGIDGEAKDEAHSDWIDVLSVDWGAMATPVRAARAVRQRGGERARMVGRMTIGDVTLTKSYDKSSPKLAEACANGTHIPKLSLEWTTSAADDSRHMRVELEDVTISSYGIDATGDRPIESISLNYAKVKTTYIPQDERGKLDSGWKVEEGEADRQR